LRACLLRNESSVEEDGTGLYEADVTDRVARMRGLLPLRSDGAYHTVLMPIARLPSSSPLFRMGP